MNHPTTFPPLTAQRYPGDGFDFRRPVMSTPTPSSGDVIDLTDESEPAPSWRNTSAPRSRLSQSIGTGQTTRATSNALPNNAEVINVDDEEGHEETTHNTADRGQRHRDSSSEVEFLYETRNPGPPQGTSNPRRQMPSDLRLPPPLPVEPSLPLGIIPGRWPAMIPSPNISQHWSHLIRSVPNFDFSNFLQPSRRPQATPSRSRRRDRHRTVLEANLLAAEFDYESLGFNLSAPSAPVPRAPTYEKPPAPREGFTRALAEGEVAVCPNCDYELGTGDDDLKRQIWVIRACGHVYCGECTKYRTKRARQNTNISVDPFATCVVDDCKSRTTAPKSMFQMYI